MVAVGPPTAPASIFSARAAGVIAISNVSAAAPNAARIDVLLISQPPRYSTHCYFDRHPRESGDPGLESGAYPGFPLALE
jgi:hypothetical protein